MEQSFNLYSFLIYLGSYVCHQLPDRTLSIGNHLLPLCSRCTGIYSGFFIGISYQFITNRQVNQIPSFITMTISSSLIFVMIFEAVGGKLQLWELSNQGKLLVGLLCGSSLSVIVFPLLNYFLRKISDNVSISLKNYIVLLAFIVFFLYLLHVTAFYTAFAIVSILGIITTYLTINLALAGMIFQWKRKNHNFKNTIMLILITVTAFIGEAFVLKYM